VEVVAWVAPPTEEVETAKRVVVSVEEVADTDRRANGVEVARPMFPLFDSTRNSGVLVP
jgi:hypothetical protein